MNSEGFEVIRLLFVRLLAYSLALLVALIMIEAVFVAFASGYLFLQFKSPMLENFAFFASLARDDLFSTLRFILLEKAWLVIQSQHKVSGTLIWSLHYYSYSLLMHGLVAYCLARLMTSREANEIYSARVLAGVSLFLLAGLYLFLGSCCTGGPNWIVQTWMLAVVFNPVTSTNATIKFYQAIKEGFVVFQLLSGVIGLFLLRRYWLKTGSARQGVF